MGVFSSLSCGYFRSYGRASSYRSVWTLKSPLKVTPGISSTLIILLQSSHSLLRHLYCSSLTYCSFTCLTQGNSSSCIFSFPCFIRVHPHFYSPVLLHHGSLPPSFILSKLPSLASQILPLELLPPLSRWSYSPSLVSPINHPCLPLPPFSQPQSSPSLPSTVVTLVSSASPLPSHHLRPLFLHCSLLVPSSICAHFHSSSCRFILSLPLLHGPFLPSPSWPYSSLSFGYYSPPPSILIRELWLALYHITHGTV